MRPALIALLLTLAVPGVASANSEIIVKRDPGLTAAERADIRADAQVRLVETLPFARTELVAARPGDVQDALSDLQADPDVTYAQLNHRRRAFTAGRPGLRVQWGIENVAQILFDDELDSRGVLRRRQRRAEAWDQGYTGRPDRRRGRHGIANHEDIEPAQIVEKRNFVTDESRRRSTATATGRTSRGRSPRPKTTGSASRASRPTPIAALRALDDFGAGAATPTSRPPSTGPAPATAWSTCRSAATRSRR